MAVDLTIADSAKGAIDALKIILKSRQQPIKVKGGSGGGGGPQLQPPKNIEVEPDGPGEDGDKPENAHQDKRIDRAAQRMEQAVDSGASAVIEIYHKLIGGVHPALELRFQEDQRMFENDRPGGIAECVEFGLVITLDDIGI